MDKPKDTERGPSFEEFQRELSKFLKERFGAKGVEFAFPQPDVLKTQEPGREEKKARREIRFDLKPKEVKSHLDRFVIQQEEAKKVLAVAICDHYHHVASCLGKTSCGEYAKQNVLFIGPTGVGKTYLIRCIADLVGVPFIKSDATKFSETGYVGGDVEDLVRDLVHKADGDVELAQYGIIYLDEVDKIAAPPNVVGRDVSGQGVQRGLLKLMEETEVPLRSSTDFTSQLQSMMEFQAKGRIERKTINTRHILFIVSGAFDGLSEIVKKRFRMRSIGFATIQSSEPDDTEILKKAQTHDFVKFGFDPEFIARLPVRVILNDLSEEDLYKILKSSEGSVIRQYVSDFKAYGIEAIFSDESLWAVARKAAVEKTGARGLFTVCERALRDFKFELPSAGISRFVITPALIEDPASELQRMVKDPGFADREFITLQIQSFEKDFEAKCGVRIHFNDEAQAWVAQVYHASDLPSQEESPQERTVEGICRERLKNYEYGLVLIGQNSGKEDFEVTREVLENPQATLDAWIRQSYDAKKKKGK